MSLLSFCLGEGFDRKKRPKADMSPVPAVPVMPINSKKKSKGRKSGAEAGPILLVLDSKKITKIGRFGERDQKRRHALPLYSIRHEPSLDSTLSHMTVLMLD